jgi:hypothetical protein
MVYFKKSSSGNKLLFQWKSIENCSIVDAHQTDKAGEVLLLFSATGQTYVVVCDFLFKLHGAIYVDVYSSSENIKMVDRK